jgi:hypothetical protein
MCFSADVSLGTFISGIICSVLCFSLGTPESKIIGMFFGFVIFMQLIEYLLWKHQECDSINKNLTIAGMVLNHLQPIVLFLVVILFNKNIPSNNLKIMLIAVLIYTVSIICYSLQFKNDCTNKSNPNNSHLIWKWNNMDYASIIYLVFLSVMMLVTYLGMPAHKVVNTMVVLISFIVSAIIYGKQEVAGALWCFFAAFAPLIYFLTQKIKF